MKKTPLKRKTALKAYTPLKKNTSLKAYKPLKSSSGLKCKQNTARKLNSPYWSVFTVNMKQCIITGCMEDTYTRIHPHHIFGGSRKTLSEKYGFMIPLRSDWHEGSNYSIHNDRSLDLKYKCACEEYWLKTLGRTKDEWIVEFGKWWDISDIKVA